MKKSIFRDILNEEYIEVNKSVSKTIEYLCEQSGMSRLSEDESVLINFYCTPKGKINVSYGTRDRRTIKPYSVYGKVVSKDDKTYVKLTSVYNKIGMWTAILSLPLIIVLMPIVLLSKVTLPGQFLIPAIVACAFTMYVVVDAICSLCRIKKYGKKLIKTMEDELKRRVRNIERWD